MFQSKAPGKIILIGEHAAVYGFPAIVFPINLFATCEAVFTQESGIKIITKRFGINEFISFENLYKTTDKVNFYYELLKSGKSEEGIQNIVALQGILALISIRETADYFEVKLQRGFQINGDSNIPVGGFGSSTAAVVAIIEVVAKVLGVNFTNEDVYNIAVIVESKIYSLESGKLLRVSGADQAAVASHSMVMFRKHEDKVFIEKFNKSFSLLENILIINSGKPENTTGSVVGFVRERYENDKSYIESIFRKISELTEVVRDSLDAGDFVKFVNYIDESSELLIKLGIVRPITQKIIVDIKKLGGHLKISGAGAISGIGSGSLLCFCEDNYRDRILEYCAEHKLEVVKAGMAS